MADPRTEAAAGADDLTDVLGAIRRLLAEDEATKFAPVPRIGVINEDAAEFLARRHGGNAALARHMVCGAGDPGQVLRAVRGRADLPVRGQPDTGTDIPPAMPAGPESPPFSAWGRPVFSASFSPPAAPQPEDEPSQESAHPTNDLVRTLSRTLAAVSEVDAGDEDEVAQPDDPVPPLRLDMADRVEAPAAAEDAVRFTAAVPMTQAELAAEFEAMLEEDDFAEAFDWKARAQSEADVPQKDAVPAVAETVAPETVDHEPVDPEPLAFEPVDAIAGETAEEPSPQPHRLSFLRPSAWVFRLPEPEAAPEVVPEEQAPARPVEDVAASDSSVAPLAERVSESRDPVSETSAKGAPAAEASSLRTVSPEAVADEAAPQGFTDEDDEGIRDLLRELIREELNGELGERFSRNLRVLVRREIAAAIDAELSRL